MPFENHGGRSFTASSIDKNAPAASGVYGLSNARQWVYIGETDNIHAELLRLLRTPGALLGSHVPSGFTFELSPPEVRLGRHQALVVELAPVAQIPNRRS